MYGLGYEVVIRPGYIGPEIRRTSSTWVKLAEGEDVLPSLTPEMIKMKHCLGMTDKAMFARYQQSEQRKKYGLGCVG